MYQFEVEFKINARPISNDRFWLINHREPLSPYGLPLKTPKGGGPLTFFCVLAQNVNFNHPIGEFIKKKIPIGCKRIKGLFKPKKSFIDKKENSYWNSKGAFDPRAQF